MNNLSSLASRTTCTVVVAAIMVGCSTPELEMTALGVGIPEVTVMDTGQGNKSVVRYDDEGAMQRTEVAVTRGLSQSITGADGAEQTNPALPDTTMVLPLQATVTGAGGDRAVALTLETPHGSDTALNDDLATAEGFQAAWETTDTGARGDVEVGAPDTATPTARAGVEASLRQWLATPVVFPTQPIGIGAQWTVSSTITEDVEAEQVVTYRLQRRDGDRVELAATVERTPTRSHIETDGVELEVIDVGSRTEKGTIVVDLGVPIPVAGELSYITTVVYGEASTDGADGSETGSRVTQRTLRGVSFGAH